MGEVLKITQLRCPSCGGSLKIPDEGEKFVKCEYCGNEYAVDTGSNEQASIPPIPKWERMQPMQSTPRSPSGLSVVVGITLIAWIIIVISLIQFGNNQKQMKTGSKTSYITADTEAETKTFSGMLGEMVEEVFGKDADSVTEQELARIQWIADRRDYDNYYIGYSFENPLENPDAELTWITVEYRSESGYENLHRFTGLKRLDTNESLLRCRFGDVQLVSLTANITSFEQAAQAFEDTSGIRCLTITNSMEQLVGLDRFPNIETLVVPAGSLQDLDAVVSLKHLKSLTLDGADGITSFSVLASLDSLENLSIDSEGLKSLEFLTRMPQLKSLEISDAKLLDLGGIEVLEGLEKLSVTECDDLVDMSGVSALTSLEELTLNIPYNCPEPSLAELTSMQKLSIRGFDSCAFLSGMTQLEELTVQYCDLSKCPDLSGLTSLRKLTCTASSRDLDLGFIGSLLALEEVNLSGTRTYQDISAIFALPNLRQLNLIGMECEIDFDSVVDNPSLEVLDVTGIKLYENVQIASYGVVAEISWDDVYLPDHLEFFAHFPNLRGLGIGDNEIKELNFTAGLKKLEVIDFSDNYVTDMGPLAALPALRQVYCKGNPISNLRVLDEERVTIISE